MLVEYCVEQARENCAIRLIIGPSPRKIELPPDYRLIFGRGTALSSGSDALLFAYGPVMLHEALLASEMLDEKGVGLKVIDMPWLNRVDAVWLQETLQSTPRAYVLEDHAPAGGLADCLLSVISAGGFERGCSLHKLAVEGYPACGTPQEALRRHGLDGASIAQKILKELDPPSAK